MHCKSGCTHCSHTHTCTHTCRYIHTYTYMYITYMYITYLPIHTYTYIHVPYTYICTHTCTYTHYTIQKAYQNMTFSHGCIPLLAWYVFYFPGCVFLLLETFHTGTHIPIFHSLKSKSENPLQGFSPLQT